MADDWKEYQEEAAEFFRSLGLTAETDVKLTGVRTTHDVDVVVRSKHVGFEVLWLVECKHWKSPVTKLHVLGLREIVGDLGADRGILLCEAGFQIGAIEAANLTNVQVTSLAALAIETRKDVSAMRLRELFDRIEQCNDRYWELGKDYRIQAGLRGEVGERSYSGARVIEFCRELLSRAFRGLYPIDTGMQGLFVSKELPSNYADVEAVVKVVDGLTLDLEARLDAAYVTFVVAHLAFRQEHDDRPAFTVADGVELGVQPSLGSSDTTGNIPFLSRLAAVRWAFRWVASIMMRSGLGPSA